MFLVATELLLFLYVYVIMIRCDDSTVAQMISCIVISVIMAITVIYEGH